jgi:Trk-type K+ transport system membrane component
MQLIVKAASAVVFAGVVFLTYYQAAPADELGWWGERFPFISFVLTAFLLFCGILFGCLFRRIGKLEKINILAELKGVFSSGSFWAALCVSPFVFFGVYAVVSASPGDPSSYLLAFQNGFFCESIFTQLTTRSGGVDATRPPTTTQPPQQAV